MGPKRLALATFLTIVAALTGAQTDPIGSQIEAARKLSPKEQPAAFEAIVATAQLRNDLLGEASARTWAGLAHLSLSQFEPALTHYRAAIGIYRKAKRPAELTEIIDMPGHILGQMGKVDDAIRAFREAVEFHRTTKADSRHASALRELAFQEFRASRFEPARRSLMLAIPIFERLRDRTGQAYSWGILASVEIGAGKVTSAYAAAKRAANLLDHGPLLGPYLLRAADLGNQVGKYAESKQFANNALLKYEQEGRSELLGLAWDVAAAAYEGNYELDRAYEGYERALSLYRWANQSAASTHHAMAKVRSRQARFSEALTLCDQAEAEASQEDLTLLSGIYGTRSTVLIRLGNKEAALRNALTAMKHAQRSGDQVAIANAANNTATVNLGLGQVDAARAALQEAGRLYAKLHDSEGAATVANNLGNLEAGTRNWNAAKFQYAKARDAFKRKENWVGTAIAIHNLGAVALETNQFRAAQRDFALALSLFRKVHDAVGESNALFSLGGAVLGERRRTLAIALLKESVVVQQRVRSLVGPLETSQAQFYEGTFESRYRILADLLITEGRLLEAQQVLDLLKADELYEVLRKSAGADTIDLSPQERAWAQDYRQISHEVSLASTELEAIQRGETLDPSKVQRAMSILAKAEQALATFLENAQAEFDRYSANPNRLDDLAASKELGRVLSQMADLKACAVYTLTTKDGVRLLVQFANGRLVRTSSIPIADLRQLILKFRRACSDPRLDPTPFSSRLYALLVEPIAKDLEQAGAKTIIWSLDGVLRHVPLAALRNPSSGRYLIEDYACSLFTPSTRDRLTEPPSAQWSGIAFAVSQGRQVGNDAFAALPKAEHEMVAVATVLGGQAVRNEEFTQDRLIAEMMRKQNRVLHIISHFKFAPGNEAGSYLLLGQGTLSMAEFKAFPSLMNGIDLLVLSACETAVGGDGKEFEGFALLAQLNGAGSVIATLWPVADESTSELMASFYRERKSRSLSKLDALRQAQILLMQGKSPSGDLTRAGSTAQSPESGFTPWKPLPDRPNHPFYWAPFVLFGSVR